MYLRAYESVSSSVSHVNQGSDTDKFSTKPYSAKILFCSLFNLNNGFEYGLYLVYLRNFSKIVCRVPGGMVAFIFHRSVV